MRPCARPGCERGCTDLCTIVHRQAVHSGAQIVHSSSRLSCAHWCSICAPVCAARLCTMVHRSRNLVHGLAVHSLVHHQCTIVQSLAVHTGARFVHHCARPRCAHECIIWRHHCTRPGCARLSTFLCTIVHCLAVHTRARFVQQCARRGCAHWSTICAPVCKAT